jgi:glyoxylase-like metal-dependent hydrolase (beta-lactamase superfamily II)
MTYKIYPIYIAKLFADMGTFCYMNFSGIKKWFPIYIWLIEGGGKRILVDVACDAEEVMKSSVLKAPYENIASLEEALGRFDLSPETVDTVILTHLHADHALNIRRFANADIYVQQEELDFSRNPHPLFAGTFPAGRFDGVDFRTVRGDYRLDDGIELLFTPGHTAGTQSVSVQTEKGKAIISGACSLPENFAPQSGFSEIVPPGLHMDPIAGYDSFLRIKKEADIIIPLHDSAYIGGEVIG